MGNSTNGNPEINFPFPVKWVNQRISDNWKRLGVKKELYILVRPDNYIALIADTLEKHQIDNYCKKYFQ
jgi:hypothetical protein